MVKSSTAHTAPRPFTEKEATLPTEEQFVDVLLRARRTRESSEQMSPKARLMAALECKATDRVPVCLPGFHLFRWADASYDDVLQEIALLSDPVYDVFLGYDPIMSLPCLSVSRETTGDGGTLYRAMTPAGEITQVVKPYAGGSNHPNRAKFWIETVQDAERFLSLPYEPSRPDLAQVMQNQERLGEIALTVVTINEPVECLNGLMGTGTFCLWSVDRPALIQRLLEFLFDRIMRELDFLLREGLGPVYRLSGGELVIPPIMAAKSYHTFAAPYARAIIERIHGAGGRAMIHCHSAVAGLLETFVALGADGTDPCEPPPLGDIAWAEAKRRVGGKLSLWGNIEYNTLSQAPEEEIVRVVRETLAHGAPGGGFVLMPCARLYETTLPARTKRNLLCYLRAARSAFAE